MATKARTEREAAYREAEVALWDSVGLSPAERRIPFITERGGPLSHPGAGPICKASLPAVR